MERKLRANLYRFGRLERYATDPRHSVDSPAECDHPLHVELYGHRRVGRSVSRGGRDQTGPLNHPDGLADDDRQHGVLHPDLDGE